MATESLESCADNVIIEAKVYPKKLMKKLIDAHLWFKLIDESLNLEELWKVHLIQKEYEDESKTM